MEKNPNYSIVRTLLIFCLSFALLLTQVNNLHMHVEHDEHVSEHVVDVHIASLLHDIAFATHHDNHHYVAIDISSENWIKKTNSFNPLMLILLFIGLFLFKPRLVYTLRYRPCISQFTPCYYLLCPPLRAPPR